jgi:hypothetical protein
MIRSAIVWILSATLLLLVGCNTVFLPAPAETPSASAPPVTDISPSTILVGIPTPITNYQQAWSAVLARLQTLAQTPEAKQYVAIIEGGFLSYSGKFYEEEQAWGVDEKFNTFLTIDRDY